MSFRVCVFKSLSFEVNCYSRGNHRVWASRSGVMLNTSISPQVPSKSSLAASSFNFCCDFFASTQTVANLRAIAFSLGAKPIRQTSRLLFAMQMIPSSPQTDIFCTGRPTATSSEVLFYIILPRRLDKPQHKPKSFLEFSKSYPVESKL